MRSEAKILEQHDRLWDIIFWNQFMIAEKTEAGKENSLESFLLSYDMKHAEAKRKVEEIENRILKEDLILSREDLLATLGRAKALSWVLCINESLSLYE